MNLLYLVRVVKICESGKCVDSIGSDDSAKSGKIYEFGNSVYVFYL